METTNWIELFGNDRRCMMQIMRDNAASDLKAGYSPTHILKQLIDIDNYEKETVALLKRFNQCADPQRAAHRYMVKVGAVIA